MNKKIKFLSSILCGGVLASTLTFVNVQAAPINTTPKLDNTFAKVTNSYDTYSCVCVINMDARNALGRYFRNTSYPNANGVRDILINNGISTYTANRVASSVCNVLIASKKQYKDPSNFQVDCVDVAVLESQRNHGEFTLTKLVGDSSNTYSNYACLPASDVKIIADEMNRLGGMQFGQLYNFLIEKGICTDEDKADSIAGALYDNWNSIANNSEDLLILEAKIGRQKLHVIARTPR